MQTTVSQSLPADHSRKEFGAEGLLGGSPCAYGGMEQDEVIRRLRGLARTPAPPAPDFTAPTVPLARASRARFGVGPIVAVVGVIALGTAALALPEGGPLRQVVAGVSAEVETDLAEVEADVEADDSGASGSASATPCDGPPPTGTPADHAAGDLTDDALAGGASAEVDPEHREAQVQAWQEWRAANCGPEATADDRDDDAGGDSDKGPKGSDGRGRGERGDASSANPHEDDPCKGPPPHANRPGNGDADRTDEERRAEQEAWKKWHHENCPPGQTNEHPGRGEGQGRPDDAGKPQGAGKPDDAGKP